MAPRQRRNNKEAKEEESHEEEKSKQASQQAPSMFGRVRRENLQALVIGLVGAALTLGSYSQTVVSPTQCITLGLVVLGFGLLVSEGFLSF